MDSNDNLVGTEDDEVSLESEEIEEIIDVEDVVSTGELSDEEGDGKEMSPESLLPSIEPSLSLHGHTANIFTVDLSEKLCASGGEDDIAYVWDIQSGTKLLECKGHKDSVICVRFNNKGNLLATGDMNGLIFVWDLTDFTLKTQFDINELEWLLWHPSADILLAGSKDGEVWMWLIPTSSCKVYPGDGSSCSAGQIVQPGTHLCAGYEDGSIRIWNLKDQSYVGVEVPINQMSPVTCVDCHKDGNLGAVGTAAGFSLIFHLKTGKILGRFDTEIPPEAPHAEEDLDSVESVSFSSTMPLLGVGMLSGRVDLWDVNTHSQRLSVSVSSGVVKTLWLDHFIIVGCLDGLIRLVDSRNGEIVSVCVGNQGEILDLAICRTNSTVISGGGDNTCRVYYV